MSILPAFLGALCVIFGLAMLGNRSGYFYLVIRPRSFVVLAAIAAASAWFLTGARAGEIKPTSEMLQTAERLAKAEYDDGSVRKYDLHFRTISGHVLWCAYANGNNWGFCGKFSSEAVAKIDRLADDYCKSPDGERYPPSHALYGDLSDLNYKCANGRSSRLPVDFALDHDGYVRSQWKALP